MATVWFVILAAMLAVYAVLDGYDSALARSICGWPGHIRSGGTVLSAIGPLWDGNEVWLIAVGGVLFFAFPLVYASSFSGLYWPYFSCCGC